MAWCRCDAGQHVKNEKIRTYFVLLSFTIRHKTIYLSLWPACTGIQDVIQRYRRNIELRCKFVGPRSEVSKYKTRKGGSNRLDWLWIISAVDKKGFLSLSLRLRWLPISHAQEQSILVSWKWIMHEHTKHLPRMKVLIKSVCTEWKYWYSIYLAAIK